MNRADSVKNVKPSEPGLHGAPPAALAPGLSFDLVLRGTQPESAEQKLVMDVHTRPLTPRRPHKPAAKRSNEHAESRGRPQDSRGSRLVKEHDGKSGEPRPSSDCDSIADDQDRAETECLAAGVSSAPAVQHDAPCTHEDPPPLPETAIAGMANETSPAADATANSIASQTDPTLQGTAVPTADSSPEELSSDHVDADTAANSQLQETPVAGVVSSDAVTSAASTLSGDVAADDQRQGTAASADAIAAGESTDAVDPAREDMATTTPTDISDTLEPAPSHLDRRQRRQASAFTGESAAHPGQPADASATPGPVAASSDHSAMAFASPPAIAPAQAVPPPDGSQPDPPAVAEIRVPSAVMLPQLLSRGEGAGARVPRPVEVDATRFLVRVARAFQSAQERGGELRLRLSPPELGSLRLELRVQDGVMTARLETETQSARATLVEHLPALRERLAEQGIRIERFDVDLMQQQGQGPGARDQGPRWERFESAGSEFRVQPETRNPKPETTTQTSGRSGWSSPNGLNVIV